MIRSHQPRGYIWNCSSEFQQTPEIRNIAFEDCLVPGAEDGFLPSERDAKRRRIERLADDFLNGQPLVITSARLVPTVLQDRTLALFQSASLGREALADYKIPNQSSANWKDVDEEWAILRPAVTSDQVSSEQQNIAQTNFATRNESIATEERMQSHCQSVQRGRRVHIAVGPSHDALRQAAELRTRGLKRATTVQESQPPTPAKSFAESGSGQSFSSPEESMNDAEPTPTPAWTSSKWIKTGVLKLRQKNVDEDCSRDELGASSLETASKSSQFHHSLATRAKSDNYSGTSSCEDPSSWNMFGMDARHDLTLRKDGAETNLCNDALNDAGKLETTPDNFFSESQTKGDSQDHILKSKGIRVPVRKSWTSINDLATAKPTTNSSTEHTSRADKVLTTSLIQDGIHESIGKHASKPQKAQRHNSASSTGTTRSRRRLSRKASAPTESQEAAEKIVESPLHQQRCTGIFRVECSVPMGDAASPFVFKKRVSKLNKNDDPDIEPISAPKQPPPQKQTRRRVTFPSSDRTEQNAVPDVEATSHSLQDSLNSCAAHESAIAPRTPLIDAHTNCIIPKSSRSGKRSSRLRKALEAEAISAGAEISRLPDSQTSSSLVHNERDLGPQPSNSSDMNDPVVQQSDARETQWLGTQNMLFRAQKDLLSMSCPDDTELFLGDKTPLHAASMRRIGAQSNPLPLQTLPQEAVPSTQALKDDWQGWSTIKKIGQSQFRNSIVASPSMSKGHVGSNPIGAADRRRSDLRYSIISADSPIQSTRLTAPPLETPIALILLDSKSNESTAYNSYASGSNQRDSSMLIPRSAASSIPFKANMASGMTAEELSHDQSRSSFQAAQDTHVGMSEDLSGFIDSVTEQDTQVLGQIVGDITATVLSTEDNSAFM